MEHIEIINRIIESEHQAQNILSHAQVRREESADKLREELDEMHKGYRTRAETRIQKVAEQEKRAAVEQIAQLEAQLAADLDRFEEIFANERKAWLDRLFAAVVVDD